MLYSMCYVNKVMIIFASHYYSLNNKLLLYDFSFQGNHGGEGNLQCEIG